MARKKKPKAYALTRGQFAGRRFRSEYAYRLALAKAKGLSSPREARQRPVAIYTDYALKELSREEAGARDRALEALAHMRRGFSLRRAASEAFTEPATVLRYAGSAIRYDDRGRVVAKPRDRLVRAMRVLTTTGVKDLFVTDSRTASLLGEFASALAAFKRTGQLRELRRFRRRVISVGKVQYRLQTEPMVLRQLLDADALSYELYQHGV